MITVKFKCAQTDLRDFFFIKYVLGAYLIIQSNVPDRVAQSVTCLATDTRLTADPGVSSSILAWSHTFAGINHEITSTAILLPYAESFKKDFCVHKVLVNCSGKSVVR